MRTLLHCVLVLLLALSPLAGQTHALGHLGAGMTESVDTGHDASGSSSSCPSCAAWAQMSGALAPTPLSVPTPSLRTEAPEALPRASRIVPPPRHYASRAPPSCAE